MDRPKIRRLEAFPIEHNGQTMVCLRDPSGLASEPVVLGMGAYFLITLFDGANGVVDLQAAFSRRFGDVIPAERIRELIATLEHGHFLDSPSFVDHLARTRDEFRASLNRAAAHAGLCYASDPAQLRQELAAFFEPPQGPGLPAVHRNGTTPAGLIAPHIDPRRGAAAYAHAYAELAGHQPPELIVILGTSHYGAGPELFTATHKNYATPLGDVQTDRDFVDRLAARYRGGDLFADELLHRNEHSIEFQALFLAWTLGTKGYKIVPILVSSFHEMVMSATMPSQDARVASFLAALSAELAREKRRVLIIAGVDFAHVGRKFGDIFAADERVIERVANEDRALIENIRRGDPAGFFADVARERDTRKICGLAPMYVQLELLKGHSARLLKYDIAREPETESAVSFASITID